MRMRAAAGGWNFPPAKTVEAEAGRLPHDARGSETTAEKGRPRGLSG